MYESVVMAGIGCGGIVHCSIFAIVVLLAVLLMLPTESGRNDRINNFSFSKLHPSPE